LIYRGIKLKTKIDCEAKQVGQVIDVYPFASKVRLFGKTFPRKNTKQGMSFIRDMLEDILTDLKPYSDMLDRDFCDAVVAAYTALLYHQNKVKVLGSSEVGVIIIPI